MFLFSERTVPKSGRAVVAAVDKTLEATSANRTCGSIGRPMMMNRWYRGGCQAWGLLLSAESNGTWSWLIGGDCSGLCKAHAFRNDRKTKDGNDGGVLDNLNKFPALPASTRESERLSAAS